MKDIFENPAPHVAEALNHTDWKLLSEQKLALLHAIDAASGYHAEALTGLLHFLDAIQDAAEKDGYPVEYLTEKEGA